MSKKLFMKLDSFMWVNLFLFTRRIFFVCPKIIIFASLVKLEFKFSRLERKSFWLVARFIFIKSCCIKLFS